MTDQPRRVDVLREIEDVVEQMHIGDEDPQPDARMLGYNEGLDHVGAELRRMADEAQQAQEEELRMWQERAETAELAVNRTRAALNDCKARGATGMQYELAVRVALGDREPQRGPGPLCHSTDPVTLRECALPAHDEGDHQDGDLRWPAVGYPREMAAAAEAREDAAT